MLASPTDEQLTLAQFLRVSIEGLSQDVAAATLHDAVAIAIGFEPTEPSSERQRIFAESIGLDVRRNSRRVASAMIGEALFAKNQEAIASLDLKAGDHVVRVENFQFDGEMQTLERNFVISSIQPNGRVFFKGGNGQGAWPTQLKKIPNIAENKDV